MDQVEAWDLRLPVWMGGSGAAQLGCETPQGLLDAGAGHLACGMKWKHKAHPLFMCDYMASLCSF